MKYRVLLHKSEEGYVAVCPGLPGQQGIGRVTSVKKRWIASGTKSPVLSPSEEGAFWEEVVGEEELREVDVDVVLAT